MPDLDHIEASIRSLAVPIENVSEDPANARTHTDRNIETIKASLRAFGQQTPIVADRRNVVRKGSGTLRAAKALGWTRIAVARTSLAGSELTAYAIADNRSGDKEVGSDWDPAALSAQLDDLRSDDSIDELTTGFSASEIDDLLASSTDGGLVNEAETPETPVEPVSRTGDLWLLGSHRILCGDSTDPDCVSLVMDGQRAGLMNTDPPYGIDYAATKNGIPRSGFRDIQARGGDIKNDDITEGEELQRFLERMIHAAIPHLVDAPAFYLWHPMLTQGTFFAAAADILIHRQIIWVKPHMVLTRSGMYHWKHELCFYGWIRGKPCLWLGDKSQVSVWEVGEKQQGRVHPTQKPVELFARPILNHLRAGEICYEPFAGSGSQIVAAEQLNRRCYAIELEPKYVDVCCKRWANATGKPPVLESSGKTFGETADERGVREAAA